MQLFYFTEGKVTNFGDDLNRWLWEELLPGRWSQGDGTHFAGIGTILSRKLMPKSKRWIVFSSGAGYDPPPADFGDPARWEILAVRGPLSCKLLHLPASKGVVDGAVLLRTLRRFTPRPETERSGIVFMPHYESLRVGAWEQVCRQSGFEFLDPHSDSDVLVERIRSAKLVLADAMHAAIVADTLRVPWIPLVTSPQINSLKWLDWTMSVEAPYRPVLLPASSITEVLRNQTLGWYGEHFNLPEPTAEEALRQYEVTRKRKEAWWWRSYATLCRRMVYSGPAHLLRQTPISAWTQTKQSTLMARASDALRRASTQTPYLSPDRALEARTDDLYSRLESLRAVPCLESA